MTREGRQLPFHVMRDTLLAQATAASNTVLQGLGIAGNQAGYSNSESLAVIVARLINALLAATGIVLVCILVYAGFLYLTAGGDQDKVKGAKRMILNSIIGIVIMTASYAISLFVIQSLTEAVEGNSVPTTTGMLTPVRDWEIM